MAGAWAIGNVADSTVYSLSGLKTTVKVDSAFPMGEGAWGEEDWAAFLTLHNFTGAAVTLQVAATWKPNLTITAAGFPPDEILKPFGFSWYGIAAFLTTVPEGAPVPGWDGPFSKEISLGDQAFNTPGADNFFVPIPAGASRELWLMIGTRAAAEVEEAAEPACLSLLVISLTAGMTALSRRRRRAGFAEDCTPYLHPHFLGSGFRRSHARDSGQALIQTKGSA